MSKKRDKQLYEFISYYKNKTITYEELQHIELNLTCNFSEYEFYIEKVQIVDNEEQIFKVYDEIRDNKINKIGPEEGYWQITAISWINHNARIFGKRYGNIRFNNPKRLK